VLTVELTVAKAVEEPVHVRVPVPVVVAAPVPDNVPVEEGLMLADDVRVPVPV